MTRIYLALAVFAGSSILSGCTDRSTASREKARYAFDLLARTTAASFVHAASDRKRSDLLVHTASNAQKSSLHHFFTLLADPARKRPVRILHYGDSILWADLMTSRIRTRLTNIFENGGRGLVAPALEAQDNQLSGMLHRQWGNWDVQFLQTMVGYTQDVGITMRRVQALGIPSSCQFDLSHDRSVDNLLVLAKVGSGGYSLFGRGKTGTEWSNARFLCTNLQARHQLPEAMQEIRLVAEPGTILYGISLEVSSGGLVYSPVMRRGICSHDLPNMEVTNLRTQLAAFAPDMVILQFGKNEAGWEKYTLDKHLSGLHWMASNLADACPDAVLLLFGLGPRINTWVFPNSVFSSVAEMNLAQRAMARQGTAVWFDTFSALGGEAGMKNMVVEGLAMSDYVHLTVQGGDVLGDIFADTLLDVYAAWKLDTLLTKAQTNKIPTINQYIPPSLSTRRGHF